LEVQADQVLVLVYRMLSEKYPRNPTVLEICFRNILHYMLLEVYCNIKYFKTDTKNLFQIKKIKKKKKKYLDTQVNVGIIV